MLRMSKVLWGTAMATMVGAMIAASPASALTYTFADNPTIEFGGKTFTNFTCSVETATGNTSGTSDPDNNTKDNNTSCENLSFEADESLLDNPTIVFAGSLSATGAGSELDIVIGMDVTDNEGEINQISLSMVGSVQVVEALVSIIELVTDSQGGFLAIASVSQPGGDLCDFDNTEGGCQFETDIDFGLVEPVTFLHTEKDINLKGAGTFSSAFLSIFRQDFEQIRVPEPSSLGLLGIGLAGLGFMLRRRRKTAA